jgi:RNA-directed DNA polymerase
MPTRLTRFTQKAREEPRERFTALMGLISDPEGLHASFERQNGRKAPGVPCFEDRLVLQAIWESEFLDCSYGFCPGRGAHDELRRVAEIMMLERTQWVVEADIKGFFDHVSHTHLMRFLEHRIADPNFLRLIQRFLKAGVMEDGAFRASEEGTPQGGLVTPQTQKVTSCLIGR